MNGTRLGLFPYVRGVYVDRQVDWWLAAELEAAEGHKPVPSITPHSSNLNLLLLNNTYTRNPFTILAFARWSSPRLLLLLLLVVCIHTQVSKMYGAKDEGEQQLLTATLPASESNGFGHSAP